MAGFIQISPVRINLRITNTMAHRQRLIAVCVRIIVAILDGSFSMYEDSTMHNISYRAMLQDANNYTTHVYTFGYKEVQLSPGSVYKVWKSPKECATKE